MEPERWQEIERLYHSAREMEASARTRFLKRECAGDAALELEVLLLLDHAEDTGTFLEKPAIEVAAKQLAGSGGTRAENGAAARPLPDAIGRYRIVRLLGEGGMGTVYEAEQDQPRRPVALKVIKPGLATGDRLWRFEHEAQALGRLQHPGIAQIYEASAADTGFGPQPYFAMELIRGLPLQEYAAAHSPNVRQKLALMVKICEAVNHAHQRGLIHRDLKPGNILVDETGQPKILDFGVARLTGSDEQATRQTDLGQIVGTLAYMSPEQVLGDPLEMDTRSDVYALGVILYELLAGRLPYDVKDRPLHVTMQKIREDDPVSLSSLNRHFRGDVETIVGKALEKDKTRRYESAADLGADIRRYLEDQPIAARPPSSSYQLRKFTRRHRGLMASIATVFVVLVAGIAAATSMAVRASRAEQEARAVSDFLQDDLLSQASAVTQAGGSSKPDPHLEVRTALDRAAARIPGKFGKQPLVEASIRQTIGITYEDLGLFAEAEQQEESALATRRRILRETDPATLKSIDHLAILYRLEGKYAQAEPLRKELLNARERSLGDLNPDTIDAMNNLALLYVYEGKLTLAEPLYSKAVNGLRRLKVVDRQSVAIMSNLAQLYHGQAKYAQAAQLYGEALEAAPRIYGAEHPITTTIMSNLALVYLDEGKFGQAEELQRKVLDVETRVLGAEHPNALASLGNMGKILRGQGKYPEAEAAFTRALESQRRVVGAEHPYTLATMNYLGSVKWYEGDYAGAEQLLTRALAGDRRVLGKDHPRTLSTLVWLGRTRLQQGRYDLADASFREALDAYRRTSPAAWERYQSESLLGQGLAGAQKFDEAEPLLISGYQGMLQRRDQIPAASQPDLDSAGDQIARLYEDWLKPDKAAEWRAKLKGELAAQKSE
jgi:serine/threonine protein kinase/tetratricopeptide (TPR) repeat protein